MRQKRTFDLNQVILFGHARPPLPAESVRVLDLSQNLVGAI